MVFGITGANNFIEKGKRAHYTEHTENRLHNVSMQQWTTSVKNYHSAQCMPNVVTLKTNGKIELNMIRCAALNITDIRENIQG